jgi:hypothetical protein
MADRLYIYFMQDAYSGTTPPASPEWLFIGSFLDTEHFRISKHRSFIGSLFAPRAAANPAGNLRSG